MSDAVKAEIPDVQRRAARDPQMQGFGLPLEAILSNISQINLIFPDSSQIAHQSEC